MKKQKESERFCETRKLDSVLFTQEHMCVKCPRYFLCLEEASKQNDVDRVREE